MGHIIEVKNLDFTFGAGELKNQVLKNVDLTVDAGEIVIMTGPSGSGKTTLLTLIGALRAAERGSVRIFGEELVGASEQTFNRTRLDIGYIFQQHNLLKSLTALQNVAMSLELRDGFDEDSRQAQAAAMLEAVGLGERLHFKPDKLSGGQR